MSGPIPLLKVGICVSEQQLSKYVLDLLRWGQTQAHLRVTHLIVLGTPVRARTRGWRCAAAVIRAYDKIWLLRHRRHRDHLRRYTLADACAAGVVCLQDPSDDQVRALGLDLLIACFPEQPLSTISSAARLGGLLVKGSGSGRMAHCEPGFEEVLSRDDATGFEIVQVTGRAASSATVFAGRVVTQNYCLLNQANLFERALYDLKRIAVRIAEAEAGAVSPGLGRPDESAPRAAPDLSLFAALAYVAGLTRLRGQNWLQKRLGRDKRWGVAFAACDWPSLTATPSVPIANPPAHFLADPFVCSEDGQDYCFVEDYDFATGLGHIAVYRLDGIDAGPGGGRATRVGQALVEPFHLSFPYLFRHQGQLYMVPESCQAKQIRLYRCVEFPLRWELERTLMDGVSAVDSMLFERDGRWWMLTSFDRLGSGDYGSELNLFYADSPLSDRWTPHPLNPICVDSTCGRNGGLLMHEQRLYRVAQRQGYFQYGKSISVREIVRLTPTDYAEQVVHEITTSFRPGAVGIHQLHANGRITVFDYAYWPQPSD